MPIKYDPLFALMKERGVKKHHLRMHQTHRIHAGVVDKLIKGGTVDTTTIANLCAILQCQPGDILEYIPDGEREEGLNESV